MTQRRHLLFAALFVLVSTLSQASGEALVIKALVEKKVTALPEGDLFWRIETFDSADEARAASTLWSLITESDKTILRFTLGSAGSISPGARKVAEVGPIPRIEAREYLLRINSASGARGSLTPIHSHPGSEAYFVLTGEQSIQTGRGVLKVEAGHGEAGQAPGQPMIVSSTGATDLKALVMFVVDANRPFSESACFPEPALAPPLKR